MDPASRLCQLNPDCYWPMLGQGVVIAAVVVAFFAIYKFFPGFGERLRSLLFDDPRVLLAVLFIILLIVVKIVMG